MSWVRLEDNVMDHPKVIALSAVALRVWLRAICHCNQHGTGGFVSDRILARIGCTPKVRSELITPPTGYEFGLFEDAIGGLNVHDYAQYQTQHAANKAESGRQGGIKSGETRRRKREESLASVEANHEAENEARARVPVPSRPVPSRPLDHLTTFDGANEVTEPERASQVIRKAKAIRSASQDTRIDPDWQPREQEIDYGARKGVDAGAMRDSFVNHYIAAPKDKGLARDWNHKFRTWIDNGIKFGDAPKLKPKLPPRREEPIDDATAPASGADLPADLFSFGKVLP